jgi:probable rRNA maturation factor
MSLIVDIQCASKEPVPDEAHLHHWIAVALSSQNRQTDTEISVRLVDTDEMSNLNETYRGKSGPTNVLAFPADLPEHLGLPLLGDIVICAPVVRTEATQQHKRLEAHWAHMAVHGTLHLLGYDHIEAEEAAVMEALESTILAGLDFPCPYREIPPPPNPSQEQSAG